MLKSFEDKIIQKYLDPVDRKVTRWMAHHGLTIMRIGLGVVFFWFGLLKFFPGLSPAEELVKSTIYFFPTELFYPILALWETVIGLGLIIGHPMRLTLLLLFLQMPGTALPLFIRPEVCWTEFPYGLTLEGQYIIKNLVLIGAGLVLGATVRGGRLVEEPIPRIEQSDVY